MKDALDSVAAQTYPCVSVIVVDDGSADRTEQVVRCYEQLHINYIRQNNSGPAAARNCGLAQVETELVAFLDADDRWHPLKLEKQIQCFRTAPQLQFCISHVQNFWSPELPEEARVETAGLFQPWIGHTSSALVSRRSAFDSIGLFNTEMNVGEDIDWFVRAAQAKLVCEIVPEVLTYRRLHPGNLSRRLSRETTDAVLRTVKHLLDWKRNG